MYADSPNRLPATLRRLAAGDSRVRTARVDDLPAGTVPRMIKIMEKKTRNARAMTSGGTVVFTLLFGAPILGLWTRTPAGLAAALAPWSLALPAAVFARRLGWSPAGAAITPLLYPLLFLAVVNSAVVTLRQGGVRWRDTFYPLDALRKGNVQ
jgi:hypothetical protein